MEKSPRIVRAAIKGEDDIIHIGSFHRYIRDNIREATGQYDKNQYTEGFMTDTNVFVDRREAGRIAFAAGQTAEQKEKLFSDDLCQP